MESGKLKNIVIAILLLLNLFLAVLVGGRRLETAQSAESARQNAIEVLRGNGVSVEDGVVPRAMDLQFGQVKRELAQEQALAAAVLMGEVDVENRGGEVYRYTNANGRIQLHSTGEFWAEFASGAYLLSDRAPGEHGAAVLARLGFDAVVLDDGVKQGSGQIVFGQTVEGVSVLDCRVTLRYDNGSLVRMSNGRRVTGQPVFSARSGEMTVATVLVRLFNGMKGLGDVYDRVEAITPSYTFNGTPGVSAQLNPVWHVCTDTGEYLLDLGSGEISRWDGSFTAAMDLAGHE